MVRSCLKKQDRLRDMMNLGQEYYGVRLCAPLCGASRVARRLLVLSPSALAGLPTSAVVRATTQSCFDPSLWLWLPTGEAGQRLTEFPVLLSEPFSLRLKLVQNNRCKKKTTGFYIPNVSLVPGSLLKESMVVLRKNALCHLQIQVRPW
jgi:hypothetical protein